MYGNHIVYSELVRTGILFCAEPDDIDFEVEWEWKPINPSKWSKDKQTIEFTDPKSK